jgi:diadenosine tetraphosphate (Ap4A) HIT family hydrolase
MTDIESNCAFCDTANLEWRTIRSSDLFLSFVSKPWFRNGQCLVIPKRHVEAPYQLTRDEGAEIMMELGRIGLALDDGFGTGIIEKFMPLQAENGIKMNHLHYHVFPRVENEVALFPVPDPNSFEDFKNPTDNEVLAIVNLVK